MSNNWSGRPVPNQSGKRIMIYIPADLADRMDQDHGLNISQICQTAIHRALDAYENGGHAADEAAVSDDV